MVAVCLATLPPELLALCIEQLDLPTLAVLSTVSKQLRHSCEQVLARRQHADLSQPALSRLYVLFPATRAQSSTVQLIVHRLLKQMPALRKLSLDSGWNYVDDSTLAALSTHCKGLGSLSNAHCPSVSAAGLRSVALQCTQLQTLNASGCHYLAWEDLYFPALQRLSLAWCQQVKAIERRQLECLRYLNLCGGPCLSAQIVHSLPVIEDLNLAFVPDVSDDSLRTLFRGSPRLRQLTLANQQGNLWSYGQWSMAMIQSPDNKPPHVSVKLVNC